MNSYLRTKWLFLVITACLVIPLLVLGINLENISANFVKLSVILPNRIPIAAENNHIFLANSVEIYMTPVHDL